MKKMIALATLALFLGGSTAWAAPEQAQLKGKMVQKADLKGKAEQKVEKNIKTHQKGKVTFKKARKGREILKDLVKKGKVKPLSKKDREIRKQRKAQAEKDLDKLLK
jgi:hypothetical protein